MTPEQIQFIQTLLAIKGSKKNDASSATMDPVLALFGGSYTPKQQMTEDDLFEFYAPTLAAFARSQDSPEANAARMIQQGANPVDVSRQIKAPKQYKGGNAWMDLLMKMSNEQTVVQRKMAEQSMEQDHFEKQGLPGYGKGYSGEQLLNMYPQIFADLLDPGRSRSSIEGDILSRRPAAQPVEEQPQRDSSTIMGSRGGLVASPMMSGALRLLQSMGGRLSSKPEPEQVDPSKLTDEEQRLADMRYMGEGGAGRQKLRQQLRAQRAGEQLEAQGRTPLTDALLMNALLQRMLG